ncbi:MAG: hypothetical protein Q8O55_01445 [Dehalococcoidales bacterium]|nr:hypothetical protein [Dehalococcoidales bacterium]
MAVNDKVVLATGSVALIASAIAMARKVKAAPLNGGAGGSSGGQVGNTLTLDEATMNLLIAIAASGADLQTLVSELLTAVANLHLAVVPNTDTLAAGRLSIGALNQWYQLPDAPVPDGMTLQLKGWPTNGGLIYVSDSEANVTNPNAVWPLLPNEAIGYNVQNLNAIFVSGTVVGDLVCWTFERRRRS